MRYKEKYVVAIHEIHEYAQNEQDLKEKHVIKTSRYSCGYELWSIHLALKLKSTQITEKSESMKWND